MSALRFDVVTLFAPMFEAVTQHGISARALDRGLCPSHAIDAIFGPADAAAAALPKNSNARSGRAAPS